MKVYREVENATARKHQHKMRRLVLEMLGGKCVKCGNEDPRVLQIDHVNGGGTKENRKYGGSRYSTYLKNGCKGPQLLCANCNLIKKHEEKEIPWHGQKHKGSELK